MNMSEPENVLARWSRRKRQAALSQKAPDDPNQQAHKPATAEGDDRSGEKRDAIPPEAAFDPASLPPIESIVAGSDIKAFLQAGVPAALRQAALRRAWLADPAIRDFIEMAENQWDFNNPTSIPGFGPLNTTDDVQKLVAQALGRLNEEGASGLADANTTAPDEPVQEIRPDDPAAPCPLPDSASANEDGQHKLERKPERIAGIASTSPVRDPDVEPREAVRRRAHGTATPK
jgi:hypothetical protein